MAIKRIDPKATFDLIAEQDSALIHETAEELAALQAEGKPTRYEQYLDNLDEKHLKFRDGDEPTRFKIRCLLNSEYAEIQAKHIEVDVVNKTAKAKNNMHMMFDVFNAACQGIVEGQKVTKVTADEIGLAVAISVGSSIMMLTTLGKHLKK